VATIILGIAGALNLASSAYAIWGGRTAFSGIVSGTIFTGIAVYYALHLKSRLGERPAT